jgi:hypothetical protein
LLVALAAGLAVAEAVVLADTERPMELLAGAVQQKAKCLLLAG